MHSHTHIKCMLCVICVLLKYDPLERLSLHLTEERSVSNTETLTTSAWITVLDVSPSPSCLFYDVSHLFFLPVLFLQACALHGPADSPNSPICQVGVLCWSLRAWGARVTPLHVLPGWKVRTLRTERSGLLETTCLLCSACLSLGKGWHRGGEMGEKEREMGEKD